MTTIFEKTVCMSVTFRMPGRNRPANKSTVTTEADKNELVLTKRIFNSDNYCACMNIALKAHQWLDSRSVPSPLRHGTHLIPETLLTEVEEKLASFTAAYNAAADAFVAEYPELIEQWKEKLKDQFNEGDYFTAEQMRARFRVDRMVLNFSPARPDEIDQRKELEQAVVEIKYALRSGLLELVERLSSMLGDRKDGKKKGFRKEALETFNEWMQLLPARLVVDDKELLAIANKAKKVMEGKSVDDLRDIEKVREQVRSELESTAKKLQSMVKDMPVRSFGFED